MFATTFVFCFGTVIVIIAIVMCCLLLWLSLSFVVLSEVGLAFIFCFYYELILCLPSSVLALVGSIVILKSFVICVMFSHSHPLYYTYCHIIISCVHLSLVNVADHVFSMPSVIGYTFDC